MEPQSDLVRRSMVIAKNRKLESVSGKMSFADQNSG